MKNIGRIFITDLKGLLKNPLALIIAIGLCIIPSLYAWFNIYSNWDPYANTANIKIAVVTEDKGYTLADGTTENMGAEVVEELKENDKVGWVILDSSDEALEGVRSGDYYAAVIVSEDFTYSMYNVFREDFKNPTITYYENEKRNAVATKITDTAVATLKQSINEKFIEVVASTIFTETNSLSAEMENEDIFAEFESKLTDLNNNLISYSAMIDTFIEANAVLEAEVSEANDDIPDLSARLKNGEESFHTAKSDLASTQTTLASFSQNVQQTMDGINVSINAIATDINNANLAQNAQATADSLNQTITDTAELVKRLNELQQSLNEQVVDESASEETKQQIQDILDTIGTLNGGAEDIQNAINGIAQTQPEGTDNSGRIVADMVNASVGNMTQILNNCSQSVANMKEVYTNSLVPQLDNIITSMSQMLTNVTDLLNNLNTAVTDMGIVFTGIETTVNETTDSLEQIQTVIDGVSDKLSELLEKLAGAEEDEKVQALMEFLQGNPEDYGEFFAQPVLVTTEEVYPISNYGSAMTPFYTVLALWVGGTILVALIKVKAEPEGLLNAKPYQLYFGRYLLFFVLGQIQAAVVILGDIYLLHCQILYPVLFWLTASLASFTFTLLIYSLALAFGDVGKAAAVVIMVIQIAGSGGTFPIELLPSIYRNIYIFFPFPYAINAMRETIGGMYGSDYMKYLGELLIFAVAALLIGLVIRLPFVKINHFVEKRMEDTGLM